MGIGEIGEALRRSTVHIRGVDPRGQSSGSGVIWDAEGTVITNAHVVGSGQHWVELWDGRGFRANIKTRDDQRDLAKLKLEAGGLPSVQVRDHCVKPGELVVAVGNPLSFTGALTTGVVHAAGPFAGLGRRPWVQATIRLAPGNSGGPLADAAGQVVGINTMIVSGRIALAIPTAIVADFVQNGPRPRLGITIRPVSLDRRSSGLVILKVDHGSPAEQASLLIGDLLVGTDKTSFAMAADLADAIAEAGSRLLKVRFFRGDRSRERAVVISLEDRSASEAA